MGIQVLIPRGCHCYLQQGVTLIPGSHGIHQTIQGCVFDIDMSALYRHQCVLCDADIGFTFDRLVRAGLEGSDRCALRHLGCCCRSRLSTAKQLRGSYGFLCDAVEGIHDLCARNSFKCRIGSAFKAVCY